MKRTTFCVALGLAAALCLSSAAAQSVGQGAGGILPRPAPTLVAPAALVATIKGPDAVSPGDLLILEAQAPAGCRCAWIVYPARSALPVDGGQRLVFASGQPGSYLFVLAVASPDGQVAIAQRVVAVGVAPPPSPPAPQPPAPPLPVPPAPPPLTGLSQAVYDKAVSTVIGLGRGTEARAMADVYDSTAAQIAAGTLTSPEKVAAATKTGIDAVTMADTRVPQWRAFYQWLRVELNKAEAAGEMDLAGIKTRWLAIAAGLREVR
ncbi:MAG: hypothetical protein V2A79_10755 [Planctomycetota bacterium]